MRLTPKLVAPSALMLVLSACTSIPTTAQLSTPQSSVSESPTPNPTISTAERPSTALDVSIAYELSADASGSITIDVTSNLADGSEMNASFFREEGHFAQNSGTLANGSVSFGPFSNNGIPLSGTCDMSIALPIARKQPAIVRACIGTMGELLTGPLASTKEITGDKVASLDAVVTVE